MDAPRDGFEMMMLIAERTRDMDLEQRIMTLSYISEHCRAQAWTILLHEYGSALYGQATEEQ